MPDITLCKDETCKIKKDCYRYTAIPGEYQSYFMNSPRKNSDKCEFLIKNRRKGDTNARKRYEIRRKVK